MLPRASPAHAANANVYLFTGSGRISPGLGATSEPQTLSIIGTASYVSTFPVGLGSYDCSFSGSGAGSMAASLGSLSGGCGPASYENMVFVHAGAYFGATAVVVGGTSSSVHMDCEFTPTNVNPITAFTLLCAVDVDLG